MRFRFIDDHRRRFPTRLLCKVLNVSHSGYYAWRDRPPSPRRERRETLDEAIGTVFNQFKGIYGSPRVHDELQDRGIPCCRNTVAKQMRSMALRSRTKRRFRPMTTNSHHLFAVPENHLARQFTWSKPNQAWVADITYIPTQEGWLYLAAVLDLHSRRVIGWSMADHMRTDLAIEAVRMALGRRQKVRLLGLIHHSDRGVQYASEAYQELLTKHGISCSMSRKGNCWDNAVMESFFSSLKTELVNHETYRTRSDARQSIFDYIERFYNRKRKHSTLGYVSPVEFEEMVA